jgi:hypothetical protein
MDQLLGIEAFSLDKILAKEPDFLVRGQMMEDVCVWGGRVWQE